MFSVKPSALVLACWLTAKVCICTNSLAGFTVNNTCMRTILFQGRSRQTCFGNKISRGKWSGGSIFRNIIMHLDPLSSLVPDHAIPYWCWKRSVWNCFRLPSCHIKVIEQLLLHISRWPVQLRGPWRQGKRLRSGSWRPPRRKVLCHPGPSRGELISS